VHTGLDTQTILRAADFTVLHAAIDAGIKAVPVKTGFFIDGHLHRSAGRYCDEVSGVHCPHGNGGGDRRHGDPGKLAHRLSPYYWTIWATKRPPGGGRSVDGLLCQ